MPGAHQFINAGTAVAALRALGLPDEAVERAPASAEWPARIQRLRIGALAERAAAAGVELWLDGGHNEAAGAALAAHFSGMPAATTHLICGMLDTKDPEGFLRHFAGLAVRLHAVPIPDSAAGIVPNRLIFHASAAGLPAAAAPDAAAALELALSEGATRVLICGSLYLAGSVLRDGAG